jgi:GNAT superfamily N-acetyltransferase
VEIQFLHLTPKHFDYFEEIEELFRSTGAHSNLRKGQIAYFTEHEERCVVVAISNGELVGVATAGILNSEQGNFYKSYGSEVINILQSKKVGWLIASLVKGPYLGQGVGRKLFEMRLSWLKEKSADYVFSNSWHSGSPFNSKRLFVSTNFKPITQFCSYVINSEFLCPICGNSCRCENTFFIKELFEENFSL